MKRTKLYRAAALLTTVVAAVGCWVGEGDEPVCTAQQTKCDGIDVVRCNAAGSGWDLLTECEAYCTDGACVAVCAPDCTGKQCGDDGCGSPCGACAAGFDCQGGACVEVGCTPDCDGKQCGDDGCSGSCGACSGISTSQAGVCVEGPCTPPDCAGLECGNDGCGGSCGSCADDQDCVDGACQDSPLSFCAIKCSQPADCDPGGGGAYSADNYVCEGGYCEYSGCNTDAECAQTYASDSHGCYAGAGYPIPYCTLKCTQAADCDLGAGGAYTAANYNCDGGYCEYIGCNSDAECAATFNDDKYGCYMGPGFLVAYCSLKCAQAADCDQGTGGAFSADNYLCEGGFCEYTGCTSDTECAESYNNSNYGCN